MGMLIFRFHLVPYSIYIHPHTKIYKRALIETLYEKVSIKVVILYEKVSPLSKRGIGKKGARDVFQDSNTDI